MSAKDNMGEQFIDVVHISGLSQPPHSIDHFMKKIYKESSSDRVHTNDVLFAGDIKDVEQLADDLSDRPYAHHYRVPNSLVSPETYADDDHPKDSGYYIQGPVRELWHDLPARRSDAVKNQRVVKFINAREAAGGLSYILPKKLIKSGDIEYKGVTELYDPNWGDEDYYWGDEDY